MKIHKYAKMFPPMKPEHFDVLVEDIKQEGLIHPIVTFEDSILDGANRFRACKKAGITPEFEKFKGKDPERYVKSVNNRNRILSRGQRAALAVEELLSTSKFVLGQPVDDITVRDMAKDWRCSDGGGDVYRAIAIKEEAKELWDDLINDQITLEKAWRIVKMRRGKKQARNLEGIKTVANRILNELSKLFTKRDDTFQVLAEIIKHKEYLTPRQHEQFRSELIALNERVSRVLEDFPVLSKQEGRKLLEEHNV